MRRIVILGVLGSSVVASTSWALQLTWVDGSKNITVPSAAICTLLVRPSSSPAAMPHEWRLVYVGTSTVDPDSSLIFLNSPGPRDATASCTVDGPASDADCEAHLTTISFCSPDGEPTSAAAYILRVDPSLQARIAAVASSSRFSGATATISSDAEVTINGGCTHPYPPVVWAANQSLDPGGNLQLVVEGIGLDHVQSVVARSSNSAIASPSRRARPSSVAAADTLGITSQTSRGLTAALANPLPLGATVVLSGGSDSVASAMTVTQQQLPSTLSGVPTMFPPYPYRPKDFAFIYAEGLFHLFYIRHDINANDDSTEVDFGHAVSHDLMNWTQLDPILHVRPTKWDDFHVWAPSIIWQDGIYYLFYAGVTSVLYQAYQRIGAATSPDLVSWQRYEAPVFEGNQVPWVFADSSQFAGCQFRDPFVMADSTQGNMWLIYYCATPRAALSQLITGIGTNATELASWQDLKAMWNTDAAHFQGYTESPHVFKHAGRWYLFFTTNSGHPIRYQYSNVSATADSTDWIGTYRLYDDDPTTDAWFASEFLGVASHEYFAAVNSANNGIEIREMNWTGVTSFSLATPSVTAVPNVTAGRDRGPSVTPLGSGAGGALMRFMVVLPSAMRAEVSVYDVVGRRIRNLVAGGLPEGVTVIPWDKKDSAGRELGAGVYFVRLDTAMGARSAKAAILR